MEKQFHVALFVETSHEFGREILRGIRDYERTLPSHWGFFLNPSGIMQDLPAMGRWECDGIIARVFSPATARRLERLGKPLVLLDPFSGRLRLGGACSAHGGAPSVPVVSTDTAGIVLMAFEHLRGCGCERFAFVHSAAPTVWSDSRAEAFARLVKSRGFPCAVYPANGCAPEGRGLRHYAGRAACAPHGNAAGGLSWEEDIRRLGAWLASLQRPVGIFAAMDERGRHVIEACRSAGLRVPEDAAVLGVDNDSLLCELCEPSLSSIALDAHGAGIEAARRLHRLMSGAGGPAMPGSDVPQPAQILVRPTHVSRRASTAIGYAADTCIADAMKIIFANVPNARFGIPELAAKCGISRRALEKHIRRSTGQTLLQILAGLRMERACSLLSETSSSVDEIAAACGFSDANYFRKAFRKHTGVPPLAFRLRSPGNPSAPDAQTIATF